MLYGFETKDHNEAVAALLVYGLYRSRDYKKFKVTPDLWGVINRAVSSCAFRATDLWEFIEKMKAKLYVSTLKPKWMRTDSNLIISMYRDPETGELIQRAGQDNRRQSWVDVVNAADHEAVLRLLAKKTSYIVDGLVRDRLEREKPYEAELLADEEEINGEE